MSDPFSVAASAAGIISLGIQVAQSLVDYYAAYKGQNSYLTRTTQKLGHLLKVLESLRSHLEGRKFRAGEQSLLENIEGLMQDCEENVQELGTKLERFNSDSPGGIRAAARQLAYPLKESTLRKLDADIDEIVSHTSLALQVLQQEDVSAVQDGVEDVKALLGLVRASQLSSAIREWLNAPDPTLNYNRACRKKHPDTGLWFVKGPSFSSWLVRPGSFLWLNGFAGCGKSVLCSTAIQHTFRYRRSNARIGLAFFFFTFNDDSKQDASAMLRTLILQLSSQLGDNRSLEGLYSSYCNATPPDQVLIECLNQVIQAFEHVYIFLDALDESPRENRRRDVLQSLIDIWTRSGRQLHLLVTSRDEIDIRDVLRNELGISPDEIVSMKNDSIDSDIASFVSGYLQTSRGLRRWENYHNQIEKALTARAKGVFRWVECQFAALESRPGSKRQLDALLASLPRDLDKTYERMLSNIDEESVGDARRILMLLCCAKRPLTVPELIDAVAVELGDNPRLNLDGRLLDEDEIRRVCPGLIEIDLDPYINRGIGTRIGIGPDSNPPRNRSTVRLAHFSVQEYLESGRAAAAFSVRRPEAHAEVAAICLTYLLDPAMSRPETSAGEYPLITYAAQCWYRHSRDGDKNLHQLERQALRLFQSTGGEFEKWVRESDIHGIYLPSLDAKRPPPAYYASFLGLDFLVAKLVRREYPESPRSSLRLSEATDWADEHGGVLATALQAATAGGHASVIRILLDHDADVNAQGRHYGTALQVASARGYESIVRLLLDENADVNTRGGYYGTALQAASCHGQKDIVHLLLESEADVDVQAGECGRALYVASLNGHEMVVRLLLESNADVNAQGGYYGTALQAASWNGHGNVAQLLIEKNADVNVQGGENGTALQAASTRGHEKLVRLLLDNDADIDARDRDYGTALQAASARGHEDVVRLLIEKNAAVNPRGGIYGTALQAASAICHENVVQLLLQRDADVNICGGHYGTALQAASAAGCESIVRLLLDRGADVNVQNERETALYLASKRGHEKVVQLLLERGADVNAQRRCGTALLAASREGHEKVVRLLLESGADVSAHCGVYGTALRAASNMGHDKIIQMLSDGKK